MTMVVVLIWLACAGLTLNIAKTRGAPGCMWFALGVIWGPIGLIAAVFMLAGKTCPACRSQVHRKATRCPRCQSDIPARSAQPEEVDDSPNTLFEMVERALQRKRRR